MQANEYLNLLERKGVTPNWWCSEEYFKKAGLNIVLEEDKVVVMDEHQQMFPTINLEAEEIFADNPNGFWADFPEYLGQEFLDYEYIYNPSQFLTMKGSQWAVFRKNCRKFPSRIGESLKYEFKPSRDRQLEKLLGGWAQRFDEVADANILLEYVFRGQNRKMLIGQNSNKLYGLNIWDENYCFINFRYSICSEEPFLAEYLRLLFYQDMIRAKKLINDGGILDRPNLKFFKDKMNPIQVREVKGKSS